MKKLPPDIQITHERIQVLQKELSVLRKREGQEKENISNYQNRMRRLEKDAEQSLSGSSKDYEKYKISVKKLSASMDVSKEILGKLQNVKKPLEEELRTRRFNLQVQKSNYLALYRELIDISLQPKLDLLMNDVEFFLNDCKEICTYLGVQHSETDGIIPLDLGKNFLDEYRRRKAQREITIKKPEESTHTEASEITQQTPLSPESEQDATGTTNAAQQEASGTPSSEETPSEGTSIPPEPGSPDNESDMSESFDEYGYDEQENCPD